MNVAEAFIERYGVDVYAYGFWVKYQNEHTTHVIPSDKTVTSPFVAAAEAAESASDTGFITDREKMAEGSPLDSLGSLGYEGSSVYNPASHYEPNYYPAPPVPSPFFVL